LREQIGAEKTLGQNLRWLFAVVIVFYLFFS
jgi:hypothetical protein